MENFRAGTWMKQPTGYATFQPEKIDRAYRLSDPDLWPLLETANLRLGELNAFAELVPDVGQFIRLHVVKEATLSSRIEGTQTSIEDALLTEEEIQPEKRDDWREVNNYIQAMDHCVGALEALPLSSRLLKQAHTILMHGVRGEHKLPGEFRRSQNWIGGATLLDAAFVPPAWADVDALMGDLENFLHNDRTYLPHILKIALGHYQFETIHPFLDGNGRIGRLLITLYFIQAGVLSKPVLYLSEFLEKHRAAYYDHLSYIRKKSDLSRWFRFFTEGVFETADKAVARLRQIVALKNDCETNRMPKLGRKASHGYATLQHLFSYPVIRPDDVARITGLSDVSVYRLIEDLERLGILHNLTGGRRNRIYVFREYLDLFK